MFENVWMFHISLHVFIVSLFHEATCSRLSTSNLDLDIVGCFASGMEDKAQTAAKIDNIIGRMTVRG